jgi:hypothetical protein
MELAAHWHRCQNLPQKTSDYSTSIQGERGSCQGWVGEGVSVKFLHRPDVEEKAGATNTLAPALRVEGKKWPEEVGIRARVA